MKEFIFVAEIHVSGEGILTKEDAVRELKDALDCYDQLNEAPARVSMEVHLKRVNKVL